MNKRRPLPAPLIELAHACGVEDSYPDNLAGGLRPVSAETLLGVLQALGIPVRSPAEAPRALRRLGEAKWQRWLEPVAVAWEGRRVGVELRLPARLADGRLSAELSLESGGNRRWLVRPADLPVRRRGAVDGVRYAAYELRLPAVPLGYHRLRVESGSQQAETLLIAAPARACAPRGKSRLWGVFLPLYALRTKKSWGAGDFSDLRQLVSWAGRQGSDLVGTLPLLPVFLDELFEPSPYSPISRLFWNEFYLDVTRAPELAQSAGARRRLESTNFQKALAALRGAPLVDYRLGMALKRGILEELTRTFFARGGPPAAFRRFLQDTPQLEDYARFRATSERRRAPWPQWPARLRAGTLRPGDYDERDRRYHVYVQWLASQQVASLAAQARENGAGLNLDVPIGAHPDGYDVWREQSVFARATSVGSPPDRVWTHGQNWGFPPLHPERVREQSYRYLIACLRHQMRHAAMLRIDHVAGLHRLFWIPPGATPGEGAYVHHRVEELYAILCLESHRQRVAIVGENLGTVPPYVHSALTRHGILKMFVVQYELEGGARRAVERAPADAMASLNTHDMPPFAGWWSGRDIADRRAMGLLDAATARAKYAKRMEHRAQMSKLVRRAGGLDRAAADGSSVLRACAEALAAGRSRGLLLNLEDLWGETEPQNLPGTGSGERPNWRRRAQYSLEEFTRLPAVKSILRLVRRRRRGKG